MSRKKTKNEAVRYSFLLSLVLHTVFLLSSERLIHPHPSEAMIEVDLQELPSKEDSRQPVNQAVRDIVRDIPRPYLRPRAVPQSQNIKVASKFPAPLMSPVFSPALVRPLISSAAALPGAVEKFLVPLPDSTERSVSGLGVSSFGYPGRSSGGGSASIGQIKPIYLPQIPFQTKVADYDQPDQTIAYKGIIHQHIESHKRYPTLAARKGLEGNVHLRFLLHRNGQVEQIQITSASKVPLLDEAAKMAVQTGNPFPPFPEGIKEASLWIDVTVNFELRRG
jgi:TonB family protein